MPNGDAEARAKLGSEGRGASSRPGFERKIGGIVEAVATAVGECRHVDLDAQQQRPSRAQTAAAATPRRSFSQCGNGRSRDRGVDDSISNISRQ